MAGAPVPLILRHLRGLLGVPGGETASDGQLLERFVNHAEESAFAALMQRHGPMVLGVCRRLLRHSHDVEDAFQATFLVLARRAAAIRKRQSVGSFLHGVAHRIALKLRAQAARRPQLGQTAEPLTLTEPSSETAWRELLAVLDEEVRRLPEKYRRPLILCYLEGKTHEEAARELDWPLGTVKGRLARGRDRLRVRLTRRGLTLPAGAFVAVLIANEARAAVPFGLARATLAYASGRMAEPAASPVLALAEGVVRALSASKLKMVLATLLVLGALGTGAGAIFLRATGEPLPRSTGDERQPTPMPALASTDHYGDPLPPGALARMGTVRFHQDAWNAALLFAPDGKSIVSTGQGENSIVFWDAATGRRLREIGGHDSPTEVLAISSDGKWLASADRTAIHLWDAASGKEIHAIALSGVRGLAFAPDGKTLASAGGDRSVRLWDARSGKELWRNLWHEREVRTVLFVPDGKTLISSSEDNTIRFWDLTERKEIRRIRTDQRDVRALALSPDGKTLAVGEQLFRGGKTENRVRLLDVASGEERRVLAGQKYGVASLAFSPDGKLLVSWGREELRLWDVATGKETRRIGGREGMASQPVFSPDSKTLATRTRSVIRLLDVATGKPLHDWPGHDEDVCTLAFSRDGKLLVSGGCDIRLWAADTGAQRRVLPGHYLASWGGGVRAVALTPDGRGLISGGHERTLRRRDLATGKETGQFHITDSDAEKDKQQVLVMNLSTDGKTLVALSTGFNDPAAGEPILLSVWDAASGKRLAQHRLPSEEHSGWGLFLPDNRTVLSPLGGKLILRDVRNGRQVFAFAASVRSFPSEWAVSPDGKLLATRTYTLAPPNDPAPKKSRREVTQTRVQLWELDTGAEVLSIPTKARGLHLAFSPDSILLAGDDKNEIAVWDAATGAKLRSFAGRELRVRSLAFSFDGKRLASGLADGTVLVWDTAAARAGRGRAKPDEKDLETLWSDLAGADGPKAHTAIGKLAIVPGRAVPLLAKWLQPVAAIPEDRLRRWLSDLDSADFQARENARRELAKLGEQVEPDLRSALSKKPSAEARKRIESLLAAPRRVPAGAALRRLRSIRVLEQIGTQEARRVLAALAAGAPAARATTDAQAALGRLQAAH